MYSDLCMYIYIHTLIFILITMCKRAQAAALGLADGEVSVQAASHITMIHE